MSEKKLMLGLPLAVLLGGSAIAIGVLPGVRDWIDQTFPGLGINGPKSSVAALKPNQEQPSSTLDSSTKPSLASMAQNVPQATEPLQAPEPMKPRQAVEFAGGEVSQQLPSYPQNAFVQQSPVQQPVQLPVQQPPVQTPVLNNDVRLAQARTLETVPPAGQYVPSRDNGNVFVDAAQVKFFEESRVAAQAEGIITKMHVDEGSMIEAGKPMIEIDSRLVLKEIQVSDRELLAATLKANDDSNVKFSKAAKEVAAAEVEISNDLQSRGAENFMEGQKKRLELKKAGFQVEVSEIEKARDKADVEVKQAKLEAAKVQLELRDIRAQRTGVVTDVLKRQGDWVRAGEEILRLTSMNKLRVQGDAKVIDSPHLLQNAPARVTISIAEGKVETIDGFVSFVSPRAGIRNQYKVHVDIDNRLTPDGQFLFREGMVATIEIMPRTR